MVTYSIRSARLVDGCVRGVEAPTNRSILGCGEGANRVINCLLDEGSTEGRSKYIRDGNLDITNAG